MKMQKGFTLFELLVSISIIAILTALATVSYSNAQKKARDAKRMEDMKIIQNAAEMYYSQGGYVYPGSSGTPWVAGTNTVLETFPTDPRGVNAAFPYQYNLLPAMGNIYCACAYTEGSVGNANSGVCGNFGMQSGPWYCVRGQQ